MASTKGNHTAEEAASSRTEAHAGISSDYIPEDVAEQLQEKHLRRWASLLKRLK